MKAAREELGRLAEDLQTYLILQRELGVESYPVDRKTLRDVQREIDGCTLCRLHEGRTNIVFGVGNPRAKLMFIGEGPGADEDAQGEPFVGRAGQLLTRIIEAIDLKREDVYITNIIKCRPPGNRNPRQDEIDACIPFLNLQIEAIQPKVICALGTFAAQTLLQTDAKISALRGRFFPFQGIKLMPTFHPAYILRNPNEKRKIWEDFKLLKQAYLES